MVQALDQETTKITVGKLTSAFNSTGTERVLPAGVEAALLRVCQEALTNVLKHASATQVTVTVGYVPASVKLTVSDNGMGFDSLIPKQWDKERGGFGLISMRERAQILGGQLMIKSELGQGTTIEATLPTEQRGAP